MKRLGWKFFVWFNAFVLGSVLLITLGLVWLVKSNSGFVLITQQAPALVQSFLGHTLKINQAKGSLWDGFTLQQVSFVSPDLQVQASDLTLQVRWTGLMNDTLIVEQLTAANVKISTPQKPAEASSLPQMPESIQLPLLFDLQKMEIGTLVFNGDNFNQINIQADSDRLTLDLARLQVTYRGAALDAAGKVGLGRPFDLDLQLKLQSSLDQELSLKADAKASGNLERLHLMVEALGQNPDRPQLKQELKANLIVAPFEKAIIQTADASAKDFDPSKWLEGAPKAILSFAANLTPNADFTKSAGRLELSNARPLSLQAGGIPVSKVVSQYMLELEGNEPKRAVVDLTRLDFQVEKQKAGQLNGKIQWDQSFAVEDTVSQWGNFAFNLRGQRVRLAAFTNDDMGAVFDLVARGSKRSNQLRVEELVLKDRGGHLSTEGLLYLSGSQESQFNLQVTDLNPALYLNKRELKGRLNGNVQWVGTVGPDGVLSGLQPEGRLSTKFVRSNLGGAPFVLNAQATGSLSRAEQFKIDLDVLGNRLLANGAYGTAGDAFSLVIKGDELKALGRAMNQDLRGTFAIDGELAGYGRDLTAKLNIQADQLNLAELVAVETINGQLQFGFKPQSVWKGDVSLAGLSKPGNKNKLLQSLELKVSGTTAAHKLDLDVQSDQYPFSRRRSVGAQLSLAGGVNNLLNNDKELTWAGSLQTLEVGGIWRPVRSLRLQKPVQMVVSSDRVQVAEFSLRGEDDTLVKSTKISWAGSELTLEGQAPWLALPRLGSVLKQQVTLETDHLVTALNWKVNSSPKLLDGHVDLKYLSGGFSILEDAEIEVPVKTLDLNVDFSRERMAVAMNLDATQIGVVAAELTVPVQKDEQTRQWGVALDQPMSGSLAAGLTDLSWLGPLISPAVRTQGEGQISLAIGGTVNQPDLQGRLFARQFNITELDQGIRLEDGDVMVDFNNDRAKLENFEFTVYHRQAPSRRIEELGPLIQGVGKVTATGQWNLDGLGGGIDLKMDRVGLIQHPERWMMLSADISVKQPVQDEQPILVRGDVLAHGAYIELPESQPQTLGSDVVIRGNNQAKSEGVPIDVLINAKLGDLFFLNAEGLKARLAGGLRLLVQDGVRTADGRTGRRLEATGTIQTAEGTYRAYGQDLTIERGVVNFQGPLSNPGLNVRAVRKGVAVEAGVEITGSANRPQVTLVSDPPVPDSEKLSWMIIGRGSNSSDRDTTLLLTAAAAIFGDSDESTTQKLAKSMGIDDFALSSGSLTAADSRAVGSQVSISPGADASASILGDEDPLLTQRLITLGKRLSQKLYLNFEQSVTTSANVVKLTYQYSRRLSFIARGGADNAVDALYQFSFD